MAHQTGQAQAPHAGSRLAPAQQAQQLQVLCVGAVQAAHFLDRGREPGRGRIQQRRERGQRVCQRHVVAALLRHVQRFIQRKRCLLPTAAHPLD